MTKQLLTETWGPVRLTLVEDATTGRLKARGEFGFCDKPTANGRVYPRKLVEREIQRLGSKMKIRAMYGELDHPDDGKTQLKRVSHLITNLKVEADGKVVGEMEIMDTPMGQILSKIVEAGGQVGVSSRGVGSVKKDRGGNLLVQEDFRLLTYDAVADPADRDALPEYTFEEADEPSDDDGDDKGKEGKEASPDDKKEEPKKDDKKEESITDPNIAELSSQLQAALSRMAQMEASMASGIERAIAEATASNASVVTESAEPERLTERIAELEESTLQLEASLLWSESDRILSNHMLHIDEANHQRFVALVGGLKQFDDIDAVTDRIETVVEEFRSTGRYHDSVVGDVTALTESLEERTALLTEAAEALVEAQQKLDEQEIVAARKDVVLGEAHSSIRSLRAQLKEEASARQEVEEQVATLQEEFEEQLEAVTADYDTQLKAVSEELVETALDLYRHQKVIGHSQPQMMLERFSFAENEEQVDSILESEKDNRRPATPPVGATSNGSRDPLDVEALHERIQATMIATPAQAQLMESAGVVSPGAGRGFEIPGLAPDKLLKLADNSPYIPGD